MVDDDREQFSFETTFSDCEIDDSDKARGIGLDVDAAVSGAQEYSEIFIIIDLLVPYQYYPTRTLVSEVLF